MHAGQTMQGYWDEKWGSDIPRVKEHPEAHTFHDFIKDKHIRTILDLGAGDGKDSLFFASKGYDVTALDFSKSGLDRLKSFEEAANIHTIQMDISQLELAPESFDAIYANLSLHYFDDFTTKKIFHDIFLILKPGSYIMVRCKSTKDALYGKGEEIGKDMFVDNGKPRHFFTVAYLKEVLNEFKLLSIEEKTEELLVLDGGSYDSSSVVAIARKN